MGQAASSEVGHFGLLDAIVVIAESWWMLILAVPLGVAAGFGYHQLQPEIYRSQAFLSLDGSQFVRFSSPEFLQKSGVPDARWRFSIEHSVPPVTGQLRADYIVTFQAGSAEQAKAGLDGVIQSFSAEFVPDSNRLTALEASRERTARSLEELDAISSALASKADMTLPGSESELYSRSVVMLLDAQSKREIELATIDAQLSSGAGGFVLSAPNLPQVPTDRSLRPVLMAGVAIAVFLVLSFAFAREAVRRAALAPGGALKLNRLRNAFRIGRR